MSDINIFEQGTRAAVRFEYKGLISIEDLWRLKLTELNAIAVELYKQLQQNVAVSFIEQTTKENNELQLKFDIVKRIIDVKMAERDAAKVEAEKKAQRQRIMQLINEKQDQALSALSIEELQAQLNNL